MNPIQATNQDKNNLYSMGTINLGGTPAKTDINAFNQQMVQGVKDPAITLAGTVPPANIPPTGNTNPPKDTTGGVDLSGYMGSTAGDIYKGAVDYYGAEANKTVDEAEIRRRNLADMQAEIDATNALYASKLARAQQEGSGRLGQSTAIQGRRGLLGSDFGAAQTQVVQGANEDIYSSIDQEKNARIQQIMTQARENAAAEIEKRTAAKTAGVKEYVTYLSGQTTQREANVKNLIDSLVNGGIDVNGLPKEGENSIAKLAESYGVTANKLKQDYINAKKAADTALAKQKAADEKASRLTVGEGERVYQYDPKTGAYSQVAYNPKTYAPKAASGTGGGLGGAYTGGSGGQAESANIIQEAKNLSSVRRGYAEQFNAGRLASIPNASRNQAAADGSLINQEKGITVANQILKQLDNGIKALQNPDKNSMLSGSVAGKSIPFLGSPARFNQEVENFRTVLDTLRAAQTINAIPLMKGTGPLSNADMRILENSQSELSPTLDETTLLEKMIQLKNELEPARLGNQPYKTMQPEGSITGAPENQPGEYQVGETVEVDGVMYRVLDNDGNLEEI